jgi:DNA-binding GntR family transcriptional regulator
LTARRPSNTNSEFQNERRKITPLEAPSLIDQVYKRLQAAISDHTLPPGSRIRQPA